MRRPVVRGPVIQRTRALALILLIPAVVILLLLLLPEALSIVGGPSDDPRLLCRSPDQSPVAEASSADLLLQNCSAGGTFKVGRGATIAVDLTGSGDVDTSGTFHDLSVSDSSILSTLAAPNTIFNTRNGAGRYFDYIAVYRGVRSGRTTLSALLSSCWNAGCSDSNRWRVTVQIT